MPMPFSSHASKLAALSTNADDVASAIKGYIESEPMRIRQWVVGEYLHHEITILRDPPKMLSPMIGDAIHNLRASLDLLACELVRLNGQSDKKVHFPFAASEDELEPPLRKGRCIALLQS